MKMMAAISAIAPTINAMIAIVLALSTSLWLAVLLLDALVLAEPATVVGVVLAPASVPAVRVSSGAGLSGSGPPGVDSWTQLHLLAVAVGLDRREGQRVGVVGQADRDDELLEVTGLGAATGRRGPRHGVDRFADVTRVGVDLRRHRLRLHVERPARDGLHQRVGDRVIVGELHLDLGGIRTFFLVRHVEGELSVAPLRCRRRGDGDVRPRGRRADQHQDGDGSENNSDAAHRVPPWMTA